MYLFKIIFSILLLIYFFIPKQSIWAQSGCCSWHGGESYCDYSSNRWVCADGTYSPTCTCGGGYGGGYQQTCPLNSYWTGSSCSCYSGYISSGGSCISYQQYCWNSLGYSSTYNYGTGQCDCMSGYVYSGGRCESGFTYCTNNYGSFSEYNYGSKSCECMSGYDWNSSRSQCISKDEICHDQLGIMSSYNSLTNMCVCFSGYSIIGGQCVMTPKRVYQQQDSTTNYDTATDNNRSDNSNVSDSPTPTTEPTPIQLIAGSSKSLSSLGNMFFFIAIGAGIWLLALKFNKKKRK